MKVGVTGTREGANAYQLAELRTVLTELKGTEFHHGDCKGVDVEAAAIAKELGYRVVCHPPKSSEQQGFFGGDEMREPLGYLQRDRNIVDATDVLLVVPLQNEWQPKGGTWYTASYAKKSKKPYIIFYPNGLEETGN